MNELLLGRVYKAKSDVSIDDWTPEYIIPEQSTFVNYYDLYDIGKSKLKKVALQAEEILEVYELVE